MKIKIIASIVIVLALIAAFYLLSGRTAVSTSKDLPEAEIQSAASSTAYTLVEVGQHADASSCWAAINGKVYDLTQWINQHPGGPDKILSICGTDGSAAFNRQHGGESRPANELTNFYIGVLQ